MTKAEQSRLAAWRLRVLQQAADDGNVARVCRRFGISRKSFYKWKRRRTQRYGVIGRMPTSRVNLRGGAPSNHSFRKPRHSLLLRHVSDCPLKSYSQFLLSLFGKTPRVARPPS